jgi:hypothetical protein
MLRINVPDEFFIQIANTCLGLCSPFAVTVVTLKVTVPGVFVADILDVEISNESGLKSLFYFS